MKLTEQQKAANQAAFRKMRTGEKLEYVFAYYKVPIILCLLALAVLGSVLHRGLTRKEPVLYLAMVNVSAGEELREGLSTGYLTAAGCDAKKQTVSLVQDLYLSEDADMLNHEYAYATGMKLMGMIQTKTLDVVLMNLEAYDIFSRKGYLLDLSAALSEERLQLQELLSPLLAENEVVLSENRLAYLLGEAEAEDRVTESTPNAFCVSSLPLFHSAGFDAEIYVGIIANSPRLEAIWQYLEYLCR